MLANVFLTTISLEKLFLPESAGESFSYCNLFGKGNIGYLLLKVGLLWAVTQGNKNQGYERCQQHSSIEGAHTCAAFTNSNASLILMA